MVCLDCESYYAILSSCMSRFCPNCYSKAAARAGLSASQRVWAFMTSGSYLAAVRKRELDRFLQYRAEMLVPGTVAYKEMKENPELWAVKRRDYRIHAYHVVVSFRGRNLETSEDVRRLRREAYRVASRHGIYGGLAIAHVRDDDDEGSHVHIVGIAGYIQPGGTDDEVLFKVIRHRGRWSLPNQGAVARVVSYACTHNVIATDLDSVTYFGCLAPVNFPQSVVESALHCGLVSEGDLPDDRCPFCGGRNVSKVHVKDTTAWPHCVVEVWANPDKPPPALEELPIWRNGALAPPICGYFEYP